MTQKTSLTIIFIIGLFGMVFSGFMTYQELFAKSLSSCASFGVSGSVFGYPACVYGFVMYGVIAVLAGMGMFSRK